jgi:hypothetical protein
VGRLQHHQARACLPHHRHPRLPPLQQLSLAATCHSQVRQLVVPAELLPTLLSAVDGELFVSRLLQLHWVCTVWKLQLLICM